MDTSLILKSIADDTRLSVIRQLVLAKTDIPCKEIVNGCASALRLSQPTMSHHLARLVGSGVVLERKTGKEKYYRLNHDLLTAIGINPYKL